MIVGAKLARSLDAAAATTPTDPLFVAPSLTLKVTADNGPVGRRAWAGQRTSTPIALLVASPDRLMPDLRHSTLAVALAIIDAQVLLRGSRRLATALRAAEPDALPRSVWRLVLPLAADGVIVAVGVALALGAVEWVDRPVIPVSLLVSVAAAASWALLLEMGRQAH